jgi:hypothetical protein
MYGDMFKGCGTALVFLCVLAIVGLAALIAGAWWFFSQISIVWGGP